MPRQHPDFLPEPYYASLLDACIDLIRMRDIIRDMYVARVKVPESLLFHVSRLTIYVEQRLDGRPRYKLDRKDIKPRHVWKWPKGGWVVPSGGQ